MIKGMSGDLLHCLMILNAVGYRSPICTSDVKNLDANGSASHPIHLHPPNDS